MTTYNSERIKKLQGCLIPEARTYLDHNKTKPEVELYRGKLAELELELLERQTSNIRRWMDSSTYLEGRV